MNKKFSLGAVISLMMITATITFSVTFAYSKNIFNGLVRDVNQRETMYSKIAEIDKKVRGIYFGQINEDTLKDKLAAGYIAGIDDKYARYIDATGYKETSEEMAGRSVGIGISIAQNDAGDFVIIRVMKGTPAQTAGLQKDDVIAKVDDESTADLPMSDVVDLIKGEAGTKVQLSVKRGGKTLPVVITRNKYELESISWRMIKDYAYVEITDFNGTTDAQFGKALNEIKSEGAAGVIFDVRGNNGGTLESVAKMLDRLLPAGNIVSSQDKDGTVKVLYTSDAKELNLPMIVLVNEKSASASELFACALRDYKKAKLVGTQTYGKGTIQNTYVLSDGSAIRFSTSLFLPPKSENFEGKGLIPDFEVELTEEQKKNFNFLKDEEDPQLQRALEAVAQMNMR